MPTRIKKNSFIIIRVKENLTLKSDLSSLKSALMRCLGRGQTNFALSFTEKSYFFSHTISMLVECIDMVHKRGGMLGIVNPNNEILDLLHNIGFLEDRLTIFPTEDAVA